LRESHPAEAPTSHRWLTGLLALLLAVVLILAYAVLIRAHQGWEDEVYWVSTCLSILRHRGAVPSILNDYPRPFSPPLLYGPTIFWMATAVMKVFGFSMRTWRSFTFAGELAYFGAVLVLFYRLRRSWAIGIGAALFSALSLDPTFAISLPGRPDYWTLAMVVAAFAVAAETVSSQRAFFVQWLSFGAWLALASSTTPRVWPLLGVLWATLPLRVGRGWLRAMVLSASAWLVLWSLLLAPLHMTILQFVASVRAASVGDAIDVSPLLGGSWGFNHAHTQVLFFGVMLLGIGIVDLTRWRQVARFQRWLIVVGVLHLAALILLVARAFNTTIYWGFVIQLAAMYAWTEAAPAPRLRAAWLTGAVLTLFMVLLRIGHVLPVFAQWSYRDPRLVIRELGSFIPRGSIVYGPEATYFFPTLSIGSEYRHPVDRASIGRASTPGRPNLPSPMRDACREPAFLIWPTGDSSAPFPPMPHATPRFVTQYQPAQPSLTTVERWLAYLPGDSIEDAPGPFAIYQLQLNSGYCNSLGIASAQ
jgi:hypothetical protein